MAKRDPKKMNPRTLDETADDLMTAKVYYGLKGQLNAELKKHADESHSKYKERTKQFAQELGALGGVKPEDVIASGARIVIKHPGKNLRLIVDGLGLPGIDLAFDLVKGRGTDNLVRFKHAHVQPEDFGALTMVRMLENKGAGDNPNIPGRLTRRVLDERLGDFLDDGPSKGRSI